MLYQVAINDVPEIVTPDENLASYEYKMACRNAKRGSVIYLLAKEDDDTLWEVQNKYYAPGASHPTRLVPIGKNTFTNAL